VKSILFGSYEQRDTVRYALRMWVTLDMILKDPESEIVIRLMDQDDMSTALMFLETFVVPKYFGILFDPMLFDDHAVAELFPSDEYWPTLMDYKDVVEPK
jgi:hypothetical protein